MGFQHGVDVGIAVEAFCEGDGVECAHQIGRREAAKFFGFAVHSGGFRFGLGQFWPDQVPIVWTLSLATESEDGMNFCARFNRDATVDPVHQPLRGCIESLSGLRQASEAFNS